MTYKTHLETVLPGRPTKCCFSLVQFINYHYDFRNSVCFIIIHYHSLSLFRFAFHIHVLIYTPPNDAVVSTLDQLNSWAVYYKPPYIFY
jgi:hypothetical protein